MYLKYFTLEEARKALPEVREFILAANAELERLAEDLIEANARFDRIEKRLTTMNILGVASGSSPSASYSSFSDSDVKPRNSASEQLEESFEQSASDVAKLQDNYLKRLNYWLDEITEQGVILRDLKTGLLDFPARQGDLEYFLCWRLCDDDINSWHLINDGFQGRKPLSVLIEYV